MSKDAKGHGSDARGGSSAREQAISDWKNKGTSDQQVTAGIRALFGLPDTHGAVSIAAQHGIPTSHLGGPQGGPIKVQELDTKRAGQPWATKKAYGNRTVAETVAKGMRTDGGYMRIKTR